MANQTFTPIIIGVGELKNRSTRIEDAIEPAEMMLQAIHLAIEDSGLLSSSSNGISSASDIRSLPARIGVDSVDVVRTWTWPYVDLPGLLAEKMAIKSEDLRWKFESLSAGNQSAKLVDEASKRIAKGESTVAVVTGAEALASLSSFAKEKIFHPPGWTPPSKAIESVFSPSKREYLDDIGGVHSIANPIQVYPLYENGFRAHRRQSIKDNNAESAKLYAKFSEVAVKHPYSWNYGNPPETESSIGTVTKRNRMICYPYPLLMNSFNNVNLAAACLLTSTEHARKLGIPESQWVYPLAGAGTRDSVKFWDRPNYHSSPAISRSIDEAFRLSGLKKDDIDLFDFYSCFPIVPKIACHHLGLDIVNPSRPITLLGGLTSFGGAGNNYSMHAITEMTRQLRQSKTNNKKIKNGLVLANGGNLTLQHVIILSNQPPSSTPWYRHYPTGQTLPEVIKDVPVPPIAEMANGEGIIETYTVEFKRDGTPERAIIVGRLKSNGHRFVANNADSETMRQLLGNGKDDHENEHEPIGKAIYVFPDPKSKTKTRRNLFRFLESSTARKGTSGGTKL